jgi:ATP-dependent DNA helicase RecG
MERVGTGIERIRRFCRENNNEIEIKPTGTHFFVKMNAFEYNAAYPIKNGAWGMVKNGASVGINDGVNVGVKLKATQKKILSLIIADKNITRKVLSEKIGISIRTIERNIAGLKEKGLLVRIGSDKAGYWQVLHNS